MSIIINLLVSASIAASQCICVTIDNDEQDGKQNINVVVQSDNQSIDYALDGPATLSD